MGVCHAMHEASRETAARCPEQLQVIMLPTLAPSRPWQAPSGFLTVTMLDIIHWRPRGQQRCPQQERMDEVL